VEWVMAELMQHPEAMRKVNEELTEIVGEDSLVEESHLPKLHYLDAAIKEAFHVLKSHDIYLSIYTNKQIRLCL
jgi:hypothetical protein